MIRKKPCVPKPFPCKLNYRAFSKHINYFNPNLLFVKN